MKTFLAASLLALSFASQAEIIRGTKDAKFADLCLLKQTSGLAGAAYINVTGRCAFDPAMNGMVLTVTVVSEDPTADTYEVQLNEYLRDVKKVSVKGAQIVIEAIQDTFNDNGDIIQAKKLISVTPIVKNKQFSGSFNVTSK